MSVRTTTCIATILFGVGMSGCAFSSDDPGLRVEAGGFAGDFLAVSDADMAATAYADGKLEPLEASDTVTLFREGAAVASAAASNSVISWPQIVDVSADGRTAFVVETRGPAPGGISEMEDVDTDFPRGGVLTVLSIGDSQVERRNSIDLGADLGSVEYNAALGALVIAQDKPGAQLAVVEYLESGDLGPVQDIELDLGETEDGSDLFVRSVHLSPDGLTLAANIANRRVRFYRLEMDETGLPTAATPLGPATQVLGSRLSVGKWTPDGRYFLISDTNWEGSQLHMLTQGPGSLTVLRAPDATDAAPTIVSRTEVGRSPEGFDISPDGRLVATINMERTYLPNSPILAFWPGRRQYSVSLLALDPNTGALDPLDRVSQAGVLPEDVIFDANGENLAVAVFHRRKGEDRERGFVDFFAIEEGGRLVSQGRTVPVVRGAHDLVLIP